MSIPRTVKGKSTFQKTEVSLRKRKQLFRYVMNNTLAKFTGKHQRFSLFFELTSGLCFTKQRLHQRSFLVKFSKLFRIYFLWSTLELLLLRRQTFRRSRPVFCKMVFSKFHEILRNTPVPESLL